MTAIMRGVPPEREAEFKADWDKRISVLVMGRKYGVNEATVRRTAIRIGLGSRRDPRRNRGGTRNRPTCMVCGGDTGGLCGCTRRRWRV